MYSHRSRVSAFARVALVVAAITLTACVDSVTAPKAVPKAPKAFHDNAADTLTCLYGWTIMMGVYVCS